MPLHKLLLRAMLWSLGLAAAAGVLAALTGGGETVWKVVGTGAITALGCGLLVPFSAMLDREKTRAVGLSGIAVVLIEFLFALALIWEIARVLFDLDWEEELALTMIFFGLAALLLAVSLKLAGSAHSRLAGRCGASATVVTFVLFLIAIWGRERLIEPDRWWESGAAVFTIGLLALLSFVGAGAAPHWRWLALPAGVLGLVLWLSRVWLGTESPFGTVVFSVSVSVAAVVVYANLGTLAPLTAGQRWLRRGAVIAASLTALLIDLVVVQQQYATLSWDADLLGRLSAAAGIVAGCGLMALLVLARINRGVGTEPAAAQINVMTVICPRCRKRHAIDIGDSRCPRCGLRFTIRVAESPSGS